MFIINSPIDFLTLGRSTIEAGLHLMAVAAVLLLAAAGLFVSAT